MMMRPTLNSLFYKQNVFTHWETWSVYLCVFVFRAFFNRPSQTNSIPLPEHLRNVCVVNVIPTLKKGNPSSCLFATSLCFITLLCSEALGLHQYKLAIFNAL